jgi:aminoglycoside phosphotransferase (APT) family kinase protein
VFRPLSLAEAPAYLLRAGLIDASTPLQVTELSGGVSSLVLLAETPAQRFIIKQALPQLRVRADWPSRPDRSGTEVAALLACAGFLPDGAVPRVLHDDPDRYCFVMSAAPANALNWKALLLAGTVEPAVATIVGRLLRDMHLGSRQGAGLAARFASQEFFDTLRVDPYLWQICRVDPSLRPLIEPLVEELLAARLALVHGDYSPKNMLVAGATVVLLDFEVAHWGDPAFDLAFCLNHFVLKAIQLSIRGDDYLALAEAFWIAYAPALTLDPTRALEPRTVRLLGALLVARVDGKSPVEYLVDPIKQDFVRWIGRRLLAERPAAVAEALVLIRTDDRWPPG